MKRRGEAFLAEGTACVKVLLGAFREWKGGPVTEAGDLGDEVGERAGPDATGPHAPSKGVWVFFEMYA